jgi:DNA-binding CsgD family transcriptional regulator
MLASAESVLADCRRGSGRLFVVEGPAGIGKTSVLAEARSRALETGMEVLHARASELERAFSYGIVRQLFEPLIRRADDDARERLFDGAAMHALPLFDPRYVVGVKASENETFAVTHGLYWLALNVAEARPLVLAIDDLHWADAASLRWLSYLVRRLEGVPVCALVTERAGEDEDPVFSQLLVDPSNVRVQLPPLTEDAVMQMVRAGLGADAEDEFCLACHRASGGNPLLVRELVRALQAEGVAPDAHSIELVERVAPDAVARSVSVRLSSLAVEAGSVARAIAVLGDGTDATHVARLADVDPRALTAAAAALARVQLIHRDEPLRFVHPVVRTVVYEGISAEQRAEAHARAAALLAEARAPLDVVSAQILQAPPGAVDRAETVLREAARRAAADGSPESAAAYLRRCLAEPLPDRERADVLIELAWAEFWTGDPIAMERLADALELLDDPDRRSPLLLGLSRHQRGWNRTAEAEHTLQQALAEREDREDELSRLIEAELLTVSVGLPELRADAYARLDSLEFDGSEGKGARLLLGARAYGDALRCTNRPRALADAQRALEGPHTGPTVWDFTRAGPIHVLLWGDAFTEAEHSIDEVVMEARRVGGILAFASAMLWRSSLQLARGALFEAEADARAAFDAQPPEVTIETPWVYAILAQILVERGALDEAARLTGAFKSDVGPIREEERQHAPLFRVRARLALARGDHRAALADALTAGRIARHRGFESPGLDQGLTWYSEAALAHHFLGEEEAAQEMAQEQLAIARRWGAPSLLGQALRIAGLVEGGDRGLELLQEAVAVLEPSPARLEAGYALTDLGASLRRANQRAAAREPLRAALELAQRCGATLLAERALEELIATGARPRRLPLTGVDALTPTERRVAAMAAEGLSNREIAQELFVTLRTVETHLSSVFRKLDLSSRTQLAAALARDAETAVAGEAGY